MSLKLFFEDPTSGLEHFDIEWIPDELTIYIGNRVASGNGLEEESARIFLDLASILLGAFAPPSSRRLIGFAVSLEVAENVLLLTLNESALDTTESVDLQAVFSESASFVENHHVHSSGNIHSLGGDAEDLLLPQT